VGQQRPIDSAAAYVSSMPAGSARNNLVNAVVNQMASEDPAKALSWANQIPDENGKTQAITNVLNQWAQNDPNGAIGYIQTMTDGPAKQQAMQSSRDRLGAKRSRRRRPVGGWLSRRQTPRSLPMAQHRQRLGQQRSPPPASNWLLQLPSGDARDAAISSFSNQIVNDDPSGACQWAESITDPAQRQNAVFRISSVAGCNLIPPVPRLPCKIHL
jgi:hypothetical protein